GNDERHVDPEPRATWASEPHAAVAVAYEHSGGTRRAIARDVSPSGMGTAVGVGPHPAAGTRLRSGDEPLPLRGEPSLWRHARVTHRRPKSIPPHARGARAARQRFHAAGGGAD